ncbi:hypothetical protein SAMN05216276_1008109 [Streptosporangium subroseum]|uniref:Uncharacterized protein n=1 Tax=Streptosporangium subroseum TaxID=106412 RepID=A0A239DXH4_9ACTN|nr:hypothetical protein [Streptosporangium subroseum]SNS36959.1 hypothetical protein SAMN05216276_1008109 [Streptosporangium subroseum]
MAVLHPRRIAWEGARVFVSAANANAYWWLSGMVEQHLGAPYRLKLSRTRLRLQSETDPRFPGVAEFSEAGAWRVCLDELLDSRPDVAPLLSQIVRETSVRLSR